MSPADKKLRKTDTAMAAFMVYRDVYLMPLLRRRLIASALHDDIMHILPLNHLPDEQRQSHFVTLQIGLLQLHWSITEDSQRRSDWQGKLEQFRNRLFIRGVIYRIRKIVHVLLCRANMPTEDPNQQTKCTTREHNKANMFLRSESHYSRDRAAALVDYPYFVFSIRTRGKEFKKQKDAWTSHCSRHWYDSMIEKYKMPTSFHCIWNR